MVILGRRRGAIFLLGVALAAVSLAGCSRFAERSRAAGPVMTEDGILFRYYAPGASRVQLAGKWPENNWARGDGSAGEADIGLMTLNKKGEWEIVVPLGPGRYYYLFWIDDNTWQTDPGNPEQVEFGTRGKTSLVVVFLQGGELEIH